MPSVTKEVTWRCVSLSEGSMRSALRLTVLLSIEITETSQGKRSNCLPSL